MPKPAQFGGISAAWDITLRLPLANGVGPWVRYGRHCWVHGGGGLVGRWLLTHAQRQFNFPLPNQRDVVLFAEIFHHRIPRCEADSIVLKRTRISEFFSGL